MCFSQTEKLSREVQAFEGIHPSVPQIRSIPGKVCLFHKSAINGIFKPNEYENGTIQKLNMPMRQYRVCVTGEGGGGKSWSKIEG